MTSSKTMHSQIWMIRAAVVLAMAAAVMTIIYLTPMPEQIILSCNRECHEFNLPMICRLKLTLEVQHTFSSLGSCPVNSSECSREYWRFEDFSRSVFVANDQLPGPSIQVCENDVLVIDVVNKLPGHSVTIHWRGQPQNEVPMMDGVPMITQCPIPSYTTFQYKFRASQTGTHMWHAYSSSPTTNNIFGALIVRQATVYDPQQEYYDVDSIKHVIALSDWVHTTLNENMIQLQNNTLDSILFNGMMVRKNKLDYSTIPKEFIVFPGKRHRFRVIYFGGEHQCSVKLAAEKHILKVIAIDGHPINPEDVRTITFHRGERVDFILNANQVNGKYALTIETIDCDQSGVKGTATIRYNETTANQNSLENIIEKSENKNGTTKFCDTKKNVCLNTMHSLNEVPEDIKTSEQFKQLFLNFNFSTPFIQGEFEDLSHINNIKFTFPPAPILTQLKDLSSELLCDINMKPDHCEKQDICECVYVEKIELGSTVEIVFINQGNSSRDHYFHLHGYSFWVVGTRTFQSPQSVDDIKQLDSEGLLFTRNLKTAVKKDTISVPNNGVVAIRFKADNPGYWMLREEHSYGWTRGLDVVLQVGEYDDFVATPKDFPKCGNWVGPKYFLI